MLVLTILISFTSLTNTDRTEVSAADEDTQSLRLAIDGEGLALPSILAPCGAATILPMSARCSHATVANPSVLKARTSESIRSLLLSPRYFHIPVSTRVAAMAQGAIPVSPLTSSLLDLELGSRFRHQ